MLFLSLIIIIRSEAGGHSARAATGWSGPGWKHLQCLQPAATQSFWQETVSNSSRWNFFSPSSLGNQDTFPLGALHRVEEKSLYSVGGRGPWGRLRTWCHHTRGLGPGRASSSPQTFCPACWGRACIVSDGNFNGFRSFQAILCHFGAKNDSNGLQNNTILSEMTFMSWKWHPKPSPSDFCSSCDCFEVSQDQFAKILCSGQKMALCGPKMTQNGLEWPEPIEIAIWNHLQWISASLAVILSGHMTSLHQFWVLGQNRLWVAKNGRKRPQMTEIGLNV